MTEYSKNGYGGIIMLPTNGIVKNQLGEYYNTQDGKFHINNDVLNSRYEEIFTNINDLKQFLQVTPMYITRLNILNCILYHDGVKNYESTELVMVTVYLGIVRTVRVLLKGVVVKHGCIFYTLIKKYQVNTYRARKRTLREYDYDTYMKINNIDTAFMYFCHQFDRICTVTQEIEVLKCRNVVSSRTNFNEKQKKDFREAGNVYDVIGVIRDINVWRANGNNKRNTFDFLSVNIQVLERGRTRKEAVQLIKKFKKDIDAIILNYIENNKKFTKYGVPINTLRLYDLTFTHDWELEYKFELKLISGKEDK